MKIRIFRVLGIVIIALSSTAFKSQSGGEGFKLTEGHVSFVETEIGRNLIVETDESFQNLCNRINKEIEREIDYCDPNYFEEMVVKVCKKEILGVPVMKGQISGSYRKPWYSMVEVHKDEIDKHGSEVAKKTAEKIIALKEHGAKHVFDFTINFKCI
ncbi:hypothetical protein [Marinimicrobium locisalis]|uniref:hypothetical protein n=1 Tax=Marinimicrobium locisalis TaxID=546022 RepID=UPI0032219B37